MKRLVTILIFVLFDQVKGFTVDLPPKEKEVLVDAENFRDTDLFSGIMLFGKPGKKQVGFKLKMGITDDDALVIVRELLKDPNFGQTFWYYGEGDPPAGTLTRRQVYSLVESKLSERTKNAK